MVRKIINILSPIAALALVWVSLQSFLVVDDTNPAEPVPASPRNPAAPQLLPELGSVSEILATTSNVALGESVPATVRELLIDQGAILLVPEPQKQEGGR